MASRRKVVTTLSSQDLYKVLLFGSADWSKYEPVSRIIQQYRKTYGTSSLLILSTGLQGAALLAETAAGRLNVHVARVSPLQRHRGQGAIPQLNQIMLMLEPDEAVGFHPDINNAKGSKDMVGRLQKAEIPFTIINN